MSWEHILIAFIFLIAIGYLYKKIIAPFLNKKNTKGCDKNCGCSRFLEEKKEEREKT